MEYFRAIFKDSRFQTLLAIAFLGIVIWDFGPALSLGGHHPFANANNRLFCLLGLAILWGLTNLRPELNPFRNQQISDVRNEIKMIRDKLINAINSIKRIQNKRFGASPKIYSHLIIGPRNAGKTSLFNSVFQDESSTVLTATQDCAIWHTSDNVFIELGEHFLPRNDDDTTCRLLFDEFIKLCTRLNLHFHDIVITLPINATFNGSLNSEYKRIQHMLTAFITQQSELPITVVFTKCDEIAGFKAFFADLTADERAQFCGFRLPLQQNTRLRNERIREQLTDLGRRFNERLLARLQQELSQKQRTILHDFPYQYDLFAQRAVHLLNELLPSCDINVNGLFFTSSRQQGATINHLTEQLREIYALNNFPQSEQVPQQIPFFTRDLLTNLLPQFARQSADFLKFSTKPNPLFIPIVATTILGIVVYQLYVNDLHRVQTATHTINRTLANKHDIISIADQLDGLKNAIDILEQRPAFLGRIIRPSHPKALVKKAQDQYDKLLHHDFVAALNSSAQEKLVAMTNMPNMSQLTELYDALKISIMLEQPMYFDQHQVYAWFANQWQTSIPDDAPRQHLLNSLKAALKNPVAAKNTNSNLVIKARQILTSTPPENLAYTVLKAENEAQPLRIANPQNALESLTIPRIFTRSMLKSVYNERIPLICEKFAEGNWVLGMHADADADENALALIQSVRTHYLNDYRDTWQNAISKLHYVPTDKIGLYFTSVKMLTSDQSPLLKFMKAIQDNTRELEAIPEFNITVSEYFAPVQSLSLDNKEDATQIALHRFADYFRPIAAADDPIEIAYNFTKSRMARGNRADALSELYTVAAESPEPLRQYLTAVADNGWQLLIHASKTYLENSWAHYVLPEYNQHINDRYPIFNTASNELSLEEFAKFFSPGGVIDTFFMHYVKPFIDDKEVAWNWKTVNGQRLELSSDALATFIRARLIQKMLFANGGHTPKAEFLMAPVALHDDLKNIQLTLNGQKVSYSGPDQPAMPMVWPGPAPTGVVLEMATNIDRTSKLTYPGVWGWFRLLDKATLEKSEENQNYKVTLRFNDSEVEYRLETTRDINPFTPGMISQFRCPKTLL